MLNFLTRVFGSRNDRMVKELGQVVREANAREASLQAMSD